MSSPRSELAEQIEVAAWAYALGSPSSTPAQLCELIVTALAAQGFLRGHAPTHGGAVDALATTVEGRS
jgi:hypothetical protein